MKLTINGFIKNNGDFICLKPMQHENYIIKHKLYAHDFIKVSESCAGTYILLESDIKITNAQIDTLYLWAKKFNRINEYRGFIESQDK
jgi:hypothetical protein